MKSFTLLATIAEAILQLIFHEMQIMTACEVMNVTKDLCTLVTSPLPMSP
jgi:hypothetical protein